MNHAWFTYPFHSSANAVWRIRTSKSFPTDWLATSSNTIMGIRHVMAQFLDTQLTNSTLRLPEGVVPSKWSWWSEIRTHEPKGTDLQSACFVRLHIHQCQRCVFAELSPLIKQVPWFFMRIHTTVLTFGYSLWLSISPQRYWVEFHRMPKNGIEPFPVSLVVARFWPLFPMSYIDLTAIWRLATIFIVPCVALGFIVFAD